MSEMNEMKRGSPFKNALIHHRPAALYAFCEKKLSNFSAKRIESSMTANDSIEKKKKNIKSIAG